MSKTGSRVEPRGGLALWGGSWACIECWIGEEARATPAGREAAASVPPSLLVRGGGGGGGSSSSSGGGGGGGGSAPAPASEHRAAASLAVEALALTYAQRLAVLTCQACSALAASFIASCHEHLGAANAAWFGRVASLGYLAQVESLLTTPVTPCDPCDPCDPL